MRIHGFWVDDTVIYPKGKTKILASHNKTIECFHVPDTVNEICANAFSRCSDMAEIYIPSSVTIIGDFAFNDCRSLRQIILPESVTTIGDNAFCGWNSLESINIPKSVVSIGKCPFGQSGIQHVVCESEAFETDGHALYTRGKKTLIEVFDKQIEQYVVADGVEEIAERAFYNCKYLISVIIPESVTVIRKAAFADCGKSTISTMPIRSPLNFPRNSSLSEILVGQEVTQRMVKTTSGIQDFIMH